MSNRLNLYPHNLEASTLIKNELKKEDIVGIVHATGTGKSYIALDYILNNPNLKTLYLVPSNSIIEHIKEILKETGLSLEKDFPNLTFRTYQALINLSRKEIEELDIDLLILDEFHHIGAPVWGNRVNTIIETHPNIKVFGMTAYTVRDRGTSYERDMANPEGNELFSNKIISRYDICDAMIEGVLPKPIYRSAYINLLDTCNELEQKLDDFKLSDEDHKKYKELIRSARKRIHEVPTINDVIKNNLKKDGKYIYFCPVKSEEGTNDINTIMEEAKSWMEYMGLSSDDYEFYITTSEMRDEGLKNRDAFYKNKSIYGKDTSKKLRIMFAINQYNEGVHAPGIDGVIIGRETKSDIVYFEQLGRALSVRGKTKEEFDRLEKLSIEELIKLANSRNLTIKNNSNKEDIIELLIAPIVIDLANNYEFIKQLENNLKNRIKEKQESSNPKKREKIKLLNPNFDIEMENIEIFETLRYVLDRLTLSWEDKYELAKKHFEYYGNLEIIQTFKTLNGIDYDENGYNLGLWLEYQRRKYISNNLPQNKVNLLNKIGMSWERKHKSASWEKMYELAKKYYNQYHNLKTPLKFKTLNGIDYDENGYNLGRWLQHQKEKYESDNLSQNKIDLLNKIGMNWEKKKRKICSKLTWNEFYKLAKIYYEHYENLEIIQTFKTLNGIDYDENGYNLGECKKRQKDSYELNKLSKEKVDALESIGMRWERKYKSVSWEEMYELAKEYYTKYQNLKIPQRFRTLNQSDNEQNKHSIGIWIYTQRRNYQKNLLSRTQINLLEQIGMIWNVKSNYEEICQICEKYNIDKELNKTILKHISYQELLAKINYLISIGKDIVIDGKLHEIFSMSNLNMKVEYGITLEELINEYYIKEKSKE